MLNDIELDLSEFVPFNERLEAVALEAEWKVVDTRLPRWGSERSSMAGMKHGMRQFGGDRIGSEAGPPFEGTAFQVKVWNAMKKSLEVRPRPYTQIAVQIGHPNSARATFMAMTEPIPPSSHVTRVVGADGSLQVVAAVKGEWKRNVVLQRGEFSTPS